MTEQPAAQNGVTEFEFPNLPEKVTFDVGTIPGEVRLDFLKGAVRSYIANRLNAANTRHQKSDDVVAWFAYDEATKADPLQTAVPKPTGERPSEPNYMDVYERAIADLKAGSIRKQGAEPKQRKTKDPLVAVVTDAVVRAIFDSKRAADPKYTFFMARKEVGVDGIQYLNDMIEEKVAQGGDRAQLTKSLEERYIGPAKRLIGVTVDKRNAELPSIL